MGSVWRPPIIGTILVVTVSSVAIIIFFATVEINFLGHNSTQEEYDDWTYAVSDAPQSLAPQWSADGSHIVFTKLNDPEGVWPYDNLYRIASDGSRLRSVSEDARWPSISPDGSSIAYGTTRVHQRLPFYYRIL